MNEQTLSVTGMTCADCARHVEKALKTLTDIVAADVAYPQGVAHIRSIQPLSLDQLNATLPKNYRVAAAPASHADIPAAKPSRLNQALDSLGGLFKPRSDVDRRGDCRWCVRRRDPWWSGSGGGTCRRGAWPDGHGRGRGRRAGRAGRG